MTSLISDSRARAGVGVRFKKQRRIAMIGLFILIGIIFVLKPPFVIRPLPVLNGTAPGSQSGQNAASKFVDPIWSSKLLPAFDEKAQDIAKILPEIRADPEAAGQKYGRREATNPYNYMVKGTGQVTEIKSESQAGTAISKFRDSTRRLPYRLDRSCAVPPCAMQPGSSPSISFRTSSTTQTSPRK